MESPKTFRAVIDLWPTRAELGRLVGAKPGAVRSWWYLDFIPVRSWLAVEEAAARCGFEGITYTLLSTLVKNTAAPQKGKPDHGDQTL